MNPEYRNASEVRYCPSCNRVQPFRQMERGQEGWSEAYLGCVDCRAETFTPAEWACVLATAEARLRWLDVPLGKVATAVAKVHADMHESFEDADLFGAPSEVGGLIVAHVRVAERAAVAAFNLTPAMYNGLLRARCDGKFIHTFCLEVGVI